MTEPKLVKSKVFIGYQADDGYSAEMTWSTIERRKEDPKGALLEGIAESARLLALFGFEAEARAEVDAAFSRIKDWREKRAEKATDAR